METKVSFCKLPVNTAAESAIHKGMAKLIWEWKSWYIWEDADRGHLPIFEWKCLVIQIITMSQHIKENLNLPKVYWAFKTSFSK